MDTLCKIDAVIFYREIFYHELHEFVLIKREKKSKLKKLQLAEGNSSLTIINFHLSNF